MQKVLLTISIEIITSKDLFIEKKGIDGLMGRSFDRIVANTNVPNPIVLTDGQRRWYVNEFDLREVQRFENEHGYKDAYLKALFAAYEDDRMWRAFAYQLFMMVPSLQAANEELRRFHLRRSFNPNTAEVQLRSMVHFPERSVLGWLWHFLADDFPLCGRGYASQAFVYEEPARDFTKWTNWTEMKIRKEPAAELFKDAQWSPKNVGKGWWLKLSAKMTYEVYATAVKTMTRGTGQLGPMEFHRELTRILCVEDAEQAVRPALRTGTEVGQREVGYGEQRRSVAHAEEWYCFAPRDELRAAISRALPAALNFDWAKWDEARAAKK